MDNVDLLMKIQDLESRLEEAEQLIEAIKAGEVDAFAIQSENEREIYTLQSGDYAYRTLIEMFGEGAVNATEDGLIVYTNPYFSQLLGLPYDNIIGTSLYDFIHEDYSGFFKWLFKESLNGNSKGEIMFAVNGREIPVYISLTSLRPKLNTVGIIISDLAEKKKYEQIVLQYQQDLELQNKKLVQSNEQLSSFAYIASHDLQEPLRKIQTFATWILEKEQANLSDTGKERFSRMQGAARRMQTLIQDLLTYSRTNTQEQNFETVNLNRILDEVKADLKEELSQKHAVIHATEMCEARIIPFQFRQLLNNLISNSLKFSRPELPPNILISSQIVSGAHLDDRKLEPGKKYCHIKVSDNGIGFEQKYSEKIFELFQRLENKSQYSGTGIGLAIVKRIVENHNGIITATSERGKEAIFDIYIPA